jgi:putative transposase
MQLIKGEYSFWINKDQLTKDKFAWQDEYFAVFVSGSIIEAVGIILRIKRYII